MTAIALYTAARFLGLRLRSDSACYFTNAATALTNSAGLIGFCQVHRKPDRSERRSSADSCALSAAGNERITARAAGRA
jgi:hypothetical protein